MQKKICDLHIHSEYSDSDMKIEEIFKIAKEKKIDCIAITDHDSIESLEEARHYSNIFGIELIDAIELSAQKANVEVHLLGYFINTQSAKLKNILEEIKNLRRIRLFSMVDKLNALGLNVDKDEIKLKLSNSVPTRLHLALFLMQKGLVNSLKEAFLKYLSYGKPAYVARFKYSVREAISFIRDVGGLVFLAHPHLLPDQSLIEEFIADGIDGLEIVYPNLSSTKHLIYKNMADKFCLLKSGGSDCHGTYKEFNNIGEISIPYDWVEEMKKKIKSLVR